MGVLSLDYVAFAREPNVGLVIIKITRFAFVTIIGFDPCESWIIIPQIVQL